MYGRIYKTHIHAHARRLELKIVPPRLWEGKTLTLRHLHLSSLCWIWRLPLQLNIWLNRPLHSNPKLIGFSKNESLPTFAQVHRHGLSLLKKKYSEHGLVASACWVQNGAWLCVVKCVSVTGCGNCAQVKKKILCNRPPWISFFAFKLIWVAPFRIATKLLAQMAGSLKLLCTRHTT